MDSAQFKSDEFRMLVMKVSVRGPAGRLTWAGQPPPWSTAGSRPAPFKASAKQLSAPFRTLSTAPPAINLTAHPF